MTPSSRAERRPRVMVVGPGRRTAGGISVVIDTLAASRLAERYELVVVMTHRDGNKLRKLVQALAGFVRAAALLAARRVDLVYLHASSGPSLRRKAVVAALSRLAGRKYVVQVHAGDFDRYYASATAWERRLVRTTLSRAALVIALSPSWEPLMQALASCRTMVIPNPVFIPPEPARLDARDPCIVSLGRLGHGKGSHTIVRALALLGQSYPGARAVLAGDGDPAPVRREAHSLGVEDRVVLPGWIGPDERARILHAASVFALPSREEGLPVALLEAMAHGLPAVVSPVGGIPDVFEEGRHGYFVPPDDPDALADKLRALLDDREAARRMGSQARSDAARLYATEVVASRIEAALDSVLADAGLPAATLSSR